MNEIYHLNELPEGWFPSSSDIANTIHTELIKELPPGHILFQVKVKVVAHRDGTDDILCQHLENKGRYTVVHLSWLGRREINSEHPYVEMDGSFEDFLEYEKSFLRG